MPSPHPPAPAPAAAGAAAPARDRYDVVVVGGGPAGSTAAHLLARAGFSVLVAERERFPRFHVGESLLPGNMALLDELGLTGRLASVPHIRKLGVEFVFGHEERSIALPFTYGLVGGLDGAINIVRADFDAALLELAAAAGAEVVHGCAVRADGRLEDGAVEVEAGGARVAARWLIDATGQSTLLGKRLGTRSVLPELRKVAFVGHFTGVERRPGAEAGYPTIVMMADAWFWFIPLDEERTSVGLVIDRDSAARAGRPAAEMVAWGVARCPFARRRMAGARALPESGTVADFSYRCAPASGPGYFLVGDAATFIDPIFSTGVCLAMMGAAEAARQVEAVLSAGRDPRRARRAYERYLRRTTAPFFRLVRSYYRHPFRELLVSGGGPFGVDRATLSLLAGAVFPRLPLAVRWRMALLYALLAVHERFPLTPRRRAYALAEMAPEPDRVQSSTRVHELLTQIEASRVEAREVAPGAAELVRQDRDER
jgi:flavin-dependent dehydrogenase